MPSYLKDALNTRQTPQSEPIPGSSQVPNSAGGHAWQVDDWTRLNRFLILGSEGGSYYASEQKLTRENAEVVMRCANADGLRTVSTIRDISVGGRAPKNDQAIFALALCASVEDERTRSAALSSLHEVCRTGTHLFQFASFVEQFRGWGRGLRSAIARWYEEKEPEQLAYQLVKYRQREGYTHRDLLRLSHPSGYTIAHKALYEWVTQGRESVDEEIFLAAVPAVAQAFELAQKSSTPQETARLVREYRLPREALKTDHLTDPDVWQAMLDAGMPMTALIRNLATMTRIGLLTNTSATTKQVVDQITDGRHLRSSRVHPIAVLAAMKTYAAGYSARGSSTWNPVPRIVDALDDAFYASFGNVEPTGKRRLYALDVSGSMGIGNVAGIPDLTPREASAAMMMVEMKTGDPYEVVAFTSSGGRIWDGNTELKVLPISPRQRLDDIVQSVSRLNFGGTDCALPMLWAQKNKREFDAIEILTDSETWAGAIHPSQALDSYRQTSGLATKLIVYGMVSNGFSIARPEDAGMLDVVGFDLAVPNLVHSFITDAL